MSPGSHHDGHVTQWKRHLFQFSDYAVQQHFRRARPGGVADDDSHLVTPPHHVTQAACTERGLEYRPQGLSEIWDRLDDL
jgi:hypothetical protein